ncbi:MAG TPA: LLM class flavin-dependent oxidoreductase [Candidatus Limnocylindrales bacterium]|nr:LLM class flavin-dependent oxidoreductase [Candidatus Limnocylindrales bacterium]
MRFGLSYYSLLDLDLAAVVRSIQVGEDAGVDYAFIGESAVRDCFVSLAEVARATSTIMLGTNVVPIYTRTPTLLAMSVVTLNEATGNRFRLLGIGAGGRLKIEPNHGVKVEKVALRMKEYVEIIREILAGRRLDYDGNLFSLHNAWIPQTYGIGTAASDLQPTLAPVSVPIYVGGTGPLVLRVAGAYADGVILNSLSTPEYIEWARGEIAAGAASVGRDPSEVEIGCSMVMAANRDPGKVWEAAQRACLYYLREDHHQFTMAKAGLGERHRQIRETYLSGDVDGALRLIDESVIDKIAFVGTPDAVRAKVRAYEDLGVTLGIIRNVLDRKTGVQLVLDNIEAVAPLLAERTTSSPVD